MGASCIGSAFLFSTIAGTMMDATPYPDINAVLDNLTRETRDILRDNLVGLYLTGSLSYGDFNRDSSDIDLVAIVQRPVSAEALFQLQAMHRRIETQHPVWAARVEASYTPQSMMANVLPPAEPRPYYGEATFYPAAQYGNEWIINNYWLCNASIPLAGAGFKTLLPNVEMADVQKASLRDLFREWEPKLREPAWLDNPHYQSYLVVNLCRILYTVMQGKLGSKKVSAAWVKSAYPQWQPLIEAAEAWGYGAELHNEAETLDFLRFVIATVSKTDLYASLGKLSF
jgi:hypothetical protein